MNNPYHQNLSAQQNAFYLRQHFGGIAGLGAGAGLLSGLEGTRYSLSIEQQMQIEVDDWLSDWDDIEKDSP